MDSWLDRFARANFTRSADTAHDLKTPLNVAVLNLELLRMRIRKLAQEDDDKVTAYTRAIEIELRRMGRIFDTFFILSTPPKDDEKRTTIDMVLLCREIAEAAGFAVDCESTVSLIAHESRIRLALKMLFEGASRVIVVDQRQASVSRENGDLRLTIAGPRAAEDLEMTKFFKFYYNDPQGNPDLSFAAARLVAETYGGGLNAWEESDKVFLRLSLPLGEQ